MASSLSWALAASRIYPSQIVTENDLASFNTFLDSVADDQYFGIDYEDDKVKIMVHAASDNTIVRTQSFEPSDLAVPFMVQRLGNNHTEMNKIFEGSSSFMKRCSGCTCEVAEANNSTTDGSTLEKRASGCYQFCGRNADCTGSPRCPSCYYVGGNCNYQKSCQPRSEL